MKKTPFKDLKVATFCLAAFILWTALVSFIDVKAIGPNDSFVGFSTINKAFHHLTGVHMSLYHITDWAGLVPVGFGFCFAILGLVQWIKRKNILKVDYNILILGVFYIVTITFYLLFESVVINYRPVLIYGFLEASYPSSTTLLVLCVMPTAIMQIKRRIKNNILKKVLIYSVKTFTVFMVFGRLLSGVHWLSDIIGGIFLSVGLVMLYRFFCSFEK